MLNVTTIIFWCFSLAGLSFWKTPFTLTVSYLIIQMGKSQKYVVSSLLDGQSKDNKPYTSSSSSASPRVWSDTQKIYTAGWYTPDVAPSTLIWLMGAKDLLEDSVPELGAFCLILISLSKVTIFVLFRFALWLVQKTGATLSRLLCTNQFKSGKSYDLVARVFPRLNHLPFSLLFLTGSCWYFPLLDWLLWLF